MDIAHDYHDYNFHDHNNHLPVQFMIIIFMTIIIIFMFLSSCLLSIITGHKHKHKQNYDDVLSGISSTTLPHHKIQAWERARWNRSKSSFLTVLSKDLPSLSLPSVSLMQSIYL